MSFTPFIEGEVNVRTIAVSGGIDISDIAHVLQGVDDKLKSKGVIPIISYGDDDYTIKQLYYGQDKDYNDSVPFSDRSQPTAKEFLENPNLYYDIAYSFGFSKSGIVEPFTIRDIITGDSIEVPIFSSIKGEAEQINVSTLGKSNKIEQLIPIKTNSSFVFFEDSSDYIGDLLSSSINLPGFISENERTILSFDDSDILFRKTTNNNQINGALRALTGTLRDSNDLIPRQFKSSAAGYTYFSSSLGTDSIAFGNLLGTS